jgi:hypothetical protein
MSEISSPTLGLSRLLLRVLILLNLLVGAGFFILLVASFAFEGAFVGYYRARMPEADAGLLIPSLRTMVVIGAPMFAMVHVLLSRILEIVDTVRQGRPFAAENAGRLRTVAWALLIIQVLHLGLGVAIRFVNAAHVPMEWDVSLAGWLAVLLAFVLARVFEEGTRLRTDLEAMI